MLRDVYVRGNYRDVILPMTVLRRLDAVLEPTKAVVLETKAVLDKEGVDYMQKRWTQLTQFLRVPGAPIDNKESESILKSAILHRKNSFFRLRPTTNPLHVWQ